MKSVNLAVICAMAAAMVLSGCSKPTVVGTWKGAVGGRSEKRIALTLSGDAKFHQTTEGIAMGAPYKVLTTGTYTAKDDTLTVEVESVKANGMSLPPVQKTFSYGYKLDGDTMTFTQGNANETVVLKRVKE